MFSYFRRNYKELRHQDELNELMYYPEIKSSIDCTKGILFTNKMTLLYKDEKENEEHIELTEDDDRFYSKLGIVFLEQYLKFGMHFWYYSKETKDSEPKPYTPGLNGLIQAFIEKEKDGKIKIKVGWFKVYEHYSEMEPDPNVIFHVFDDPNMKTLSFRSKLRPLLKNVKIIELLRDNIIDLELGKRNPGFYLQNTPLTAYGEQTRDIYNLRLELHRDNKHKEDICEDETDFFQVSDLLDQYYKTLFVQDSTSQSDACDEQIMVPLQNDKFIQDKGIPFLAHKVVRSRDIHNPQNVKNVMKFGSNIVPIPLASKEGNDKLYDILKNQVRDEINKVFGMSAIKNFDNTKLGSLVLIKTLNENINNLKEIVEEMLSTCINTLVKSQQGKNFFLTKNNKQFVGVKIHPRTITHDTIVTQLIKIYGPTRPDIVNEILEKTSINKLDTLEELSEEMKKEKQEMKLNESKLIEEESKLNKEKSKLNEEESKQNKDKEDVKMEELKVGKKRDISNQKYSKTIKYFSSCSEMLRRYESCEYNHGDKLKVANDNRTYLNNKIFIVKTSVCKEYEVIDIWDQPTLWNNPIVMNYMTNTKRNYEVLYVGIVEGKKYIISQKNLVPNIN